AVADRGEPLRGDVHLIAEEVQNGQGASGGELPVGGKLGGVERDVVGVAGDDDVVREAGQARGGDPEQLAGAGEEIGAAGGEEELAGQGDENAVWARLDVDVLPEIMGGGVALEIGEHGLVEAGADELDLAGAGAAGL